MPDTLSAPLLLPHRSNTQAMAVAQQFAGRPTLRQVLERQLHERLLEQFPSLVLDISTVKLAIPNQRRGWDLRRLTDVVLDYLGNGTPLNLTEAIDERRCFLSQRPPARLTYDTDGPREPDMAIIEQLITDLPATLPVGFQDALNTYWNGAGDTGASRWQWLGDLLADNLNSSASLLPAGPAQDMLYAVSRQPDRRERQTVRAYCLEGCVIHQGRTTRLLSTDLLLVQANQVLLCQASGNVEGFASLDAFNQAWGQRLAGGLLADKILVKHYEPDGNVFDIQAALLLNQQLDDLDAIHLPAADGVRALEQRFADATDPVPMFVDAPAPDPTHQERIRTALPDWLQTASADQRFAYRQALVDQARVQRQTGGASFADGIESLQDFTLRSLREQMRRDHPESSVEPGNLQLTFHVPVGDLHGGYLAPVSMSLSELAINNLAAAPQGRLTLHDTSGAALPAWLNEDYVLGEKGLLSSTPGLIRQVDIGRHYPQTIRELLLGDSPEIRERETLFGEQLEVQLPRQALEHTMRREHGFTFEGYRYVKAVLQRSAPGRVVDGQDIVIRPLAFARAPGALPDIVAHMFIIEPRASGSGPHLLYRPLYQDALRQFASRQALFDAIAEPGALQDSVLAWLTDKARPIYSHGGFHSPHILRFGQGDDTVQWPAPPPAQLAQDPNGGEVPGSLAQSLASGNLTQYLYGSNARALVDLADRDSVSNAESRWAVLLEGGWLLFNALLMPLLRGPAMAAGWILQLAVSLKHDITGLQNDDAAARELAWVDVLLNIGLLVLHVASPTEIAPRIPAVRIRTEPSLPTLIEQGPVGLPSEPVAGDNTQVDFVHSNARDASRRRLLDALRELHVAWPVPAPSPVQVGPHRGLYAIGQRWHASVAGLLFQVKIDAETDALFIVHPQKPLHPGFELKTDGQGHWSLELGLKLRGGGPKNRLKAKLAQIEQQRAQARENAHRIEGLIAAVSGEQLSFIDGIFPAKTLLETLDQQLLLTHTALRASPDNPVLMQAHAATARSRAQAKVSFQVLLERFERTAGPQQQQRRDLLEAYRQIKVADGKFDYEANALEQYTSMLASDELRIAFRDALHRSTFVSDQGESLSELAGRPGDAQAIRYVYDLVQTNFAASERHLEAVIDIENLLETLAGDLKSGPAERLKYLGAEPHRRFYNSVSGTLESLDLLSLLSIDLAFEPTTAEELHFFQNQRLLHTIESSRVDTHLELLSTEGFTAAERKAVLLNLIDHYSRRLQIYRALTDINSPLVMPRYMPLLIERLETVRSAAEADLAEVLREDEFLPPQTGALKRLKIAAPGKRVFKSRDKGALVGELQAPDADTPFTTIITRNPITQQPSGRFIEHPGEGWVEIVEAKPSHPVAPAPARSLASLRTQAQQLLDDVGSIESSIKFQKSKLKDPLRRDDLNPHDWDDMLQYQAQRIESIADEIHRQHQEPQTVERLRQRAGELRNQGRQHCIEGLKAQRPRQENIDYLRTHAAVDIGLVHGPQRTAAGDYVSEFAVREKNALTVLWYAHFHYARVGAPAAEYTKAHLKRPEHRFITLKDLLAQAGPDSRTIARNLYNPITAPLDQRLFLSLQPA
ncbi:dermonecrotic toxin domain-containing protein [Pseudomonas sp. MIACH]|uniref:dermonecrotic toxin domain-containing protein n=1 Tax=Pseudomonas sp. MIACH TaxID=1078355 RepID=UPI00069E9796|nr:DUF6543 domain-containing protein [Pseudomonas sp. MIACH]